MNIDFSMTPQQIVVTMINNDNGSSLSPDSLLFGIPQVVDIGVVTTKHYNTSLLLTGKPGSRYAGSERTVYYNRINLSIINAVHNVVFTPTNLNNISDLLPAINAEYKIDITKEDIIDAPLPLFTGTDPMLQLPVVLVAAPESLLFIGTTTFMVDRPGITLADIIKNQYLTDPDYELQ